MRIKNTLLLLALIVSISAMFGCSRMIVDHQFYTDTVVGDAEYTTEVISGNIDWGSFQKLEDYFAQRGGKLNASFSYNYQTEYVGLFDQLYESDAEAQKDFSLSEEEVKPYFQTVKEHLDENNFTSNDWGFEETIVVGKFCNTADYISVWAEWTDCINRLYECLISAEKKGNYNIIFSGELEGATVYSVDLQMVLLYKENDEGINVPYAVRVKLFGE